MKSSEYIQPYFSGDTPASTSASTTTSYRSTTGTPPANWSDAMTLLGRYPSTRFPMLWFATRAKDGQNNLVPNTVFIDPADSTDPRHALLAMKIPTAACSTHQIFINKAYCEPLPPHQLAFIILHECMHWLRNDPYLMKDKQKLDNRWWQAVEYRINGDIVNILTANRITSIQLPPDGYYNDKYTDANTWHTKRIREQLPDQQEQQDQQDQQLSVSDILSPKEDSQAQQQDQQQQQQQQQQDQQDQQRHDRLQQLSMLANTSGTKLPGEQTLHAELEELKAKIYKGPDPMDIIKRFTKNPTRSVFTWSPRDRQLPCFPSRTRKNEPNDILIALDVSGSMLEFAGKLLGCARIIARSVSKVDILTFDTNIIQIQTVKPNKSLPRVQASWGGTNLTPVLDYINEPASKRKYKCAVIMTDGCGTCRSAQPKTPMLWVMPKEDYTLTFIPFPVKTLLV